MLLNEWICLRNVSPSMITNATTLLQVPATSNEIDNEQQDQQINSNDGIENCLIFQVVMKMMTLPKIIQDQMSTRDYVRNNFAIRQ
jgi:hypothetical protein